MTIYYRNLATVSMETLETRGITVITSESTLSESLAESKALFADLCDSWSQNCRLRLKIIDSQIEALRGVIEELAGEISTLRGGVNELRGL